MTLELNVLIIHAVVSIVDVNSFCGWQTACMKCSFTVQWVVINSDDDYYCSDIKNDNSNNQIEKDPTLPIQQIVNN